MKKVLVNGGNGRLGQSIVALIGTQDAYTLVGIGERDDNLADRIRETKADIVIDVTHAGCVFENTQIILESDARPIIGTSGLNAEKVESLQKIAKAQNTGGIIAPNFSIGAILMMKLAKEAAPYFSRVEIIEKHHDKKKDSPSGTAIKTAEMIASTQAPLDETQSDARGALHANVPIHSLRLPGVYAEQSVLFGNTGETLSIEHRSLSREAFGPGVLLALDNIMHVDDLVYGLENFL